MIRCVQRIVRRCVPGRLGLLLLLWGGLALGACTLASDPTLPPATAIAPRPPTATALAPNPPTATPEQPTATPEQPSVAPAPTETEAASQGRSHQAVTLTILHTNDVAGETYPCG